METNELIGRLREEAKRYQFHPLPVLLTEAADRLEEQDEIIKQYHKADCFLAAHGWEWEEGGSWYDD